VSTNSYHVAETSRLLNTSAFTIRRLIKTKQLRAVRIGGQWRIFEEDLLAYIDDWANRPREVSAQAGERVASRSADRRGGAQSQLLRSPFI
jgi:excisionase family DNA binding protein